ncbi:hypothetical protein [Microviridae sp.]|nr:hypothetical protein [Microviridae sp.]
MTLNARGHEVPDPTPLEITTKLRKPESMEDMIRRFVRNEGSRVAQNEGKETFEEANDFEPEEHDEDQMDTLYTVPDMIPEQNPDGFVEKLDGSPGEAFPGPTEIPKDRENQTDTPEQKPSLESDGETET